MVENELTAALLDTFPSAMLAYNCRGELVRQNDRWTNLAHLAGLDGCCLSIDDFTAETGTAPLAPAEQERMQEITRNGRVLLVRQKKFAAENEEHIAVLLDDITGLRGAMHSVARETADALWKIRSRTTGIQNALNLLVEYFPDTVEEDSLVLLHDSLYETWQLSRYCDNLRDLSGIRSGVMEFCMETFPLEDAVRAAVGNAMIYADYRKKKCTVNFGIPGNITVRCDWPRLVYCIDSVVLNSIIYSPKEVTIDIAAECDEEQVVLSIKDNGQGIDDEELTRVFSYGFRGVNTDRNAYNGMGIELYLARRILSRMNGTIELTSRKEKGTTVEMTLAGNRSE
ncbi:MAG: hypothetical protein GF350_06280 [Chitinivibrionales bacterium]|nr:hypothetical protein [Chitinivibrionales bacterium]